MTAFVISLLLKAWPFILALGGALLWGWKQRSAGAAKVRAEQERAKAKAIKDKKELDDEIADLGPADLDTRFKRWLQDGR